VAGQTNLLRHYKQLLSSAITFGYNPKRPISLVVEYEPEAERAQLELAQIGFDQIAGFPVAENLKETLQMTQLGVRDFLGALDGSQRPLVMRFFNGQRIENPGTQKTGGWRLRWVILRSNWLAHTSLRSLSFT